jgi:hypothetical protein
MIFSIWAATAADAQVISAMEILPQAASAVIGELSTAKAAKIIAYIGRIKTHLLIMAGILGRMNGSHLIFNNNRVPVTIPTTVPQSDIA